VVREGYINAEPLPTLADGITDQGDRHDQAIVLVNAAVPVPV
jgi:hypothetical protein